MQDLTIAAVSMNSPLGEVSAVLDSIAQWTHRAREQNAELILFPELVVHGHCTPETWDLAEAVPDGASVRRLEALAQQHGVFLSVGLSEKERDIVYNTQVLVGPDGYLGKQRKIHMSRDEVLYYKGGREIPVIDIGICRIGTVICYDNQFPEVARILALKGADVLLMPHAARIKMWTDEPGSAAEARQHTMDFFVSSYAMRARENACFAVLTNQAGRAGYVDIYPPDSPQQPHHCGGAIVFGPDGSVMAATQRDEIRDEMIVARLEARKLASERSLPNYTLRTRRPELFGELTRVELE